MVQATAVQLQAGRALIEGDLTIPARAAGLVVFAHGSGSSRFSRRNQSVARVLQGGGYATLLLDLLTRQEDAIDEQTREYRFDVDRLGHRIVAALDWAASHPTLARLPVACFGASTGAAAALIATAERPEIVRAVISRGGRPDLAGYALPKVQAPTLLIVGGDDEAVIELNRAAMRRMRAPVQLEIVPGATHLFEEPGALESVSQHALRWCTEYLKRDTDVIRDVPTGEWRSVLERFGREHRAWLATVHVVDTRGIVTCSAQVPLKSAIASVDAVQLEFLDEGHSIGARCPCALRIQQTAIGLVRALEIDTLDGQFIRVAFRATALPEQLDGLAPGELTAARSPS